jgi:hypothetical protein
LSRSTSSLSASREALAAPPGVKKNITSPKIRDCSSAVLSFHIDVNTTTFSSEDRVENHVVQGAAKPRFTITQRHTYTQTHRYSHTDTDTNAQIHTDTHTDTDTQTHRNSTQQHA